jgi:hypothetical protein
MQKTHLGFFFGAAWFALGFNLAAADVIETKSGARLVGKVTGFAAYDITLSTDYAGDIKIKKSEVVSVQTDEPRFVRLNDGTVVAGTVQPATGSNVQVAAKEGAVTTPVDEIAATWALDGTDPEILARRPKWSLEAAADITGKSGNRDEFGSALSARAKRIGPHDMLQFYTAYKRQETDGKVSADQFKAGADYSNNFAGRTSWYVRDEAGFDRVKDIEFYNLAATGFGYDFIKTDKQIFTGRAGLSHRYESYGNPATPELSSAGLDLGLHHEYTFRVSKLVNDLTYTPAFEDFGNYRATHESYYEIPLAFVKWKLRLGVANDFTSRPGTGVEKLDTTYFTRFVLNWK